MGTSVSSAEYAVQQAEGYVRQAENTLKCRKQARDDAKKNGNYKSSSKCFNRGGKVGNSYDCNVWDAEDALKTRKAQLAEAKKRLAEAKKKK